MGKVTYDAMKWVEEQERRDEAFRQRVQEGLAAMQIEQQLIRLREARGLSQTDLARLIGVSQAAVAKAEAGEAKNVELRTLLKHVLALGGQLEVRITGSGPGGPKRKVPLSDEARRAKTMMAKERGVPKAAAAARPKPAARRPRRAAAG